MDLFGILKKEYSYHLLILSGNDMLLSLIIPVYKVEQYIEECLESVCRQLHPNMPIEIIIVNDGTPDQSMNIAQSFITKKYANLLDKINFINQGNKGLSGARNTGIDYSKSEYLMFLDSDDKVEENFFDQILSILNKNTVDIIQFKAYRFHEDSSEKMEFMPDSPISGLHVINDEILSFTFNTANWFSWLRIYNKKMFSNLRFPVGKLYEDAYTTPFIFLNAKSIYFINECLIGYRYNSQGITAKISKKTLEDLKGVAECFALNISKCNYFSISLIAISQYYITQSFNHEGYRQARYRWFELKEIIKNSQFDESLLRNRGNKLFYKFGVFFLCFEQMLIKLKVRK